MSGGHCELEAPPENDRRKRNHFSIPQRYREVMFGVMAIAACGLILVNCWTFVRFWQDKLRAQAGERRIPEADLLGLALIGGSPGALLARHILRHKTRKEPFSTHLWLIVMLQLGALIGLGIAEFA